jgi:hypothetical protein
LTPNKSLGQIAIDGVDMGWWIVIPEGIPSTSPSTHAKSTNITPIETLLDVK